MQQALITTNLHNTYSETAYAPGTGIMHRFIQWCALQEEKRFFWTAISMLGLIGMVLPVTMYAIVYYAHQDLTLLIAACIFNVTVFALNLAAQPPKITLPVLFIALAADVLIIIASVTIYFA